MINRHVIMLSISHLVTDVYTSMLPILWPLFRSAFGLSYSMVGLAMTFYTIGGSLTQPIFGYLGDRFGSRYLAVFGTAWVAICMGLIGFAWDYPSLVVLVVLAGLGSAAYHPQGAMNASIMAGKRRGFGMAVFMLGGNMGFALGPVIAAVAVTTALGVRSTAVLAIPGLLLAARMYTFVAEMDRRRFATVKAVADAAGAAPRASLMGMALVIVIIILRGWAEMGVTQYLPLLYESRGLSLGLASQMLFIKILVGSLAGLAAGLISDRYGRRWLLIGAFLLAGPALLVFLYLPGIPAEIPLALYGLGIGSTLPLTVVMGQEMLPRHAGVASGLTIGLGFVASGMGVALTGVLADMSDLTSAMASLAVLPFLAGLLCTRLPRRRPAPIPATE